MHKDILWFVRKGDSFHFKDDSTSKDSNLLSLHKLFILGFLHFSLLVSDFCAADQRLRDPFSDYVNTTRCYVIVQFPCVITILGSSRFRSVDCIVFFIPLFVSGDNTFGSNVRTISFRLTSHSVFFSKDKLHLILVEKINLTFKTFFLIQAIC